MSNRNQEISYRVNRRIMFIEPPFYRLYHDQYCLVKYHFALGYLSGAVIKNIEKKFNGKKVVTFVRKFEKFYPAENYHQDYYQESFINYLMYKKACGREEQLKRIWQ